MSLPAVTIVRNVSGALLPMPAPYKGLLAHQHEAVVSGSPDLVKTRMGGDQFTQGLFVFTAGLPGTGVSALDEVKGQSFPVTTGAIAISIDPTNGADSGDNTSIEGQAAADARGAFKTAPEALLRLPRLINHAITLTYVAGSYTIADADFALDFSRFKFGPGGSIVIDGGGVQKIAAATTDFVVTATDNTHGDLTVTDPGYSADQFTGRFAKVTAGLGLGQFNGIASHATTDLKLAGSIGFDNTSRLQAWEPQTKLTFAGQADVTWKGATDLDMTKITIQNIGFSGGAAKRIILNGLSVTWLFVYFDYIRFQNLNQTPMSRISFGAGPVCFNGVAGNTANTCILGGISVFLGAGGSASNVSVFFKDWMNGLGTSSQEDQRCTTRLGNVTFRAMGGFAVRSIGNGDILSFTGNTRALTITDAFLQFPVAGGSIALVSLSGFTSNNPAGANGLIKDVANNYKNLADLGAANGDFLDVKGARAYLTA